MKDPVQWRADKSALSNKTVNEIMDRFWAGLMEDKVDLPIGAKVFKTSSKLNGESNEDDNLK